VSLPTIKLFYLKKQKLFLPLSISTVTSCYKKGIRFFKVTNKAKFRRIKIVRKKTGEGSSGKLKCNLEDIYIVWLQSSRNNFIFARARGLKVSIQFGLSKDMSVHVLTRTICDSDSGSIVGLSA
jgi:hypothetical protein